MVAQSASLFFINQIWAFDSMNWISDSDAQAIQLFMIEQEHSIESIIVGLVAIYLADFFFSRCK